jgi:hypothetical protein
LVDALAGEHRLRREAIRAEQEAGHWSQRAAFAEARGLPDLAASARARARQHGQRAQQLRQQAGALHAEVERLRTRGESGRVVGRAPPASASVEARIAALEIDDELERLRRRRREDPALPSVDQSDSVDNSR